MDVRKRFGHSMCFYEDKLLVFGGGGLFMQKIKKRETFNDLQLINLETLQAEDLHYAAKLAH